MKKWLLNLTFLLAFILINPLNTTAKENICVYEFNDTKLEYKISNNNVNLPFNDNEYLTNTPWYHGANFKEDFLKSTKTSKNNFICPSLVIEESNLFTTIFVNGTKTCNGVCTQINSSSSDIKVIKTSLGSAIGYYQKDSYFIPTFRTLSDGTVEYSVNNQDFYDISKEIKTKDNETIKIDDKLAKILFTNESMLDKIYRCVSLKNGQIEYNLTTNNKYCKNDLSKNDNQGYESSSFNGAKGAEGESVCQERFLGNPNDPDSVAWLLNKLLNYVRILAPMIVLILSGIDFGKSIVTGDDETMQKNYKRLITRLVIVVILFFVPDLVSGLLNVFGLEGDPICVFKN